MGCPIRSEVWGCLAVGNMELACEFSYKDGQLDHYGESIWAEKFLAALECEAFFENDLHKQDDIVEMLYCTNGCNNGDGVLMNE